jgi:penicillin G amidase
MGEIMTWKEIYLYPVLGAIFKTLLWPLSRTRLPQVKGTICLNGPQASVEILRDRWGVAHIYAQNTADAVFGQGFVHAQERLWQMDFTRRVVSGRLAEVLGESALPVDRVMRMMSLRLTAEQEAEAACGDLRTLLESYCAGVNASLARAIRQHKLPLEFLLLGYQPQPWQIADIYSWGKLMCWTLAANWQSEVLRSQLVKLLGPEKTSELEIDLEKTWAVILDLGQTMTGKKVDDAIRSYTGSGVADGAGSNNWVVHGSRTASGKPLLANDMHLELTEPGIWFENHLVGGEFEVTGVTMPGVPMVVSGHNGKVAWGFTDSCPDTQDLFEEHIRPAPEGGWEVEFQGDWLPVTVRHEEILVKGGKKVVEDFLVTRHGPIINQLIKNSYPDAPPLALRWTALEPDQTFRAIYAMNVAGDCLEFREALRHFDNPSQNVVYSDTKGNIAYSMNGRIPVRKKGDGTIPAPGWNGDYEWTGYIPFDELPHLYNPPSGYIATANNQVQRPDFPHFLGRDFLVSERAGRIVELLATSEKVDIPYIQKMQSDQVSLSSRIFARHLGALKVDDQQMEAAVELMRNWDGKLAVDSPQACIFEATSRFAIHLVLEHWLGDLGSRIQGKGPFTGQWPDHAWEWFLHLLEQPESCWFDLGEGENRDKVLLLALKQALEFLNQALGPRIKDWKWGNLHQLTFGHILGMQKPLDRVFNIGPFPVGGDGNTIWASYTSYYDLERRPVTGPPFRFIADLSDLDHCWAQLVPGQSGHLASRHRVDGIKPWYEGDYHPMLFSRDDVERDLEARLVLVPVHGT